MLGKTILVPLTNSLYVPGKLADLENVIVDVGTGYYVKKVSLARACSKLLHLTALLSARGCLDRIVHKQQSTTRTK